MSKRFGRRAATLASTALLWIAIASGFVPLLHHAGAKGGATCIDGENETVVSALHAEDCEHHDAHESEDPADHCPVCRGLQQSVASFADRAPSVVPVDITVDSVRLPATRNSGRDLAAVVAARGPPPAA